MSVAFDVFVVRKPGVPGQEELAVVDSLGIPAALMDQVAAREQVELEQRELLGRGPS